MFVDSDHAGDKGSCRLRIDFLIHVNTALAQLFSKKQSKVETSLFSTEFVTMKQVRDALRGLRYNVRMMGFPISGPSYIYGDSMSVVHNTSRPESVLKKKSNSVSYHKVHESVAIRKSIVGHIPSTENVADLMTKVLHGHKRRYFVSNILYDIHDNH